jgi:hypothetical protein
MEQEKSDRERLIRGAKSECEGLKGAAERFCMNDHQYDGNRFYLASSSRGFALILNDVCARFIAENTGNSAETIYRITLSRKAPGPGDVFDDESPLKPQEWDVELTIQNGELLWSDKLAGKFTTDQFTEEIAKRLVTYHIAYERKYGR